jgi:zinc D-Ala-D-Ala carboxypeptidase
MIPDYFSRAELVCKHCGRYQFDGEFLVLINDLRHRHGKPLYVNSAYRCPLHPIEKAKEFGPGAHASGKAIDLSVEHGDALSVISIAMDLGIKRIGVNQKGENRFIHLDVCEDKLSPALWSY